jgi:hypothetical protein
MAKNAYGKGELGRMHRIRVYVLLVVVLTVVIASAAMVIGYYQAAQSPSPTTSPTSTSSPVPTASPTPTATPTATPTPAGSANPTPTPTPSPTGLTTQEMVRDSVMTFIVVNHAETTQFITGLVWTGGRVTPPTLLGAETYMYYSQGWDVTINYSVGPNPIYKVTADYSASSIGIPYRIVWKGTWQNHVINETSYVFAQ